MIEEYGFLIEQMHCPSDPTPVSEQEPPVDPGNPFNHFFPRWEDEALSRHARTQR